MPTGGAIGRFRQPRVGGEFANASVGNIRHARRVEPASDHEGVSSDDGKLAGRGSARRSPAEHQGAKGAILGYGAAALARRSVPALAALALGGWAFRKWRDQRRATPVLSFGSFAFLRLALERDSRNRARPCP